MTNIPLDHPSTSAEVKSMLAELSGFDEITDDHELHADLDLDSLDLSEFIITVESRFEMEVAESEVDNFARKAYNLTVKELVDKVYAWRLR